MKGTPVTLLSVPFILGIFLAYFLSEHISLNLWILLATLVFWLAVMIFVHSKSTHYTFTVVAILFAFTFGVTRFEISHRTSADKNQYSTYKRTYNSADSIDSEDAIIKAMTTGDKSGIPKNLKKQYARAGVSHILALSGFHLTVIYCILQFFFLGKIIPFRWRWIPNIIILLCLWAFAHFTHYPPSLVRATIMISLLILCNITGRDSLSLNTLALAAVIMLVYDPLWLINIGFQLSFVSVLGIIVCMNISSFNAISSKISVLNYIWGTMLITIICSAFTAPLVAYYFGQIPVLGIVSNLAVTVLASCILFGSALWWIFKFTIPVVAALIYPLLIWFAELMNSVVLWVADISWATVEWHPNLVGVILSYTALALIIVLLSKISKV